MKSGSVVLDMAASPAGGNVALSQPNQIVTTANGVKVIGYTNLPSRLPSTASNLFGSNVARFLLSMGPATHVECSGRVLIDYADPAVRGMLVVHSGALTWPNPDPYAPPPPAPTRTREAVVTDAAASKDGAGNAVTVVTFLTVMLIASGSMSPNEQFTSLLAVFALSSFAGQQVILALHFLKNLSHLN